MTLSELLIRVPELEDYIRYMPEALKDRYTIRTYPAGTIIHQKDAELDYFGIVCEGYHRVINEFENGNVFMIERNDPIDFIGEVTILAGKPRTSVTIETTTPCTVLYFSRKDFEDWIAQDIHFLRLVSREEIHEETGISVKTLNHTIRRLKEEGLVGITKGKVTMTPEQIARAKEYIGKQTCKGKV